MSRSPPAGNRAFGFCLDCVCLLTPETHPLPPIEFDDRVCPAAYWRNGRSCAALSRTKHAERSSPHFMGCAKPPQSPTKPPFAPTKPPLARPNRVRNKTPIPASCGSLCKTQHPCKSPPLRSARERLQNPICSVTRSNPSPTGEERTAARHESTPRSRRGAARLESDHHYERPRANTGCEARSAISHRPARQDPVALARKAPLLRRAAHRSRRSRGRDHGRAPGTEAGPGHPR